MIRAFLQVNRRFQVYTTQDITGMIRAFLQVNCRIQVYTTQDTTGMIRAFLRVNRRFQVYTTQDTTGMIRAFLQVNCRFQIYTLPRILQHWLEHFWKLTVDFRYTCTTHKALVRVFLHVKGVFRHTAGLINVFLQVNCSFQVYTTQDSTAG